MKKLMKKSSSSTTSASINRTLRAGLSHPSFLASIQSWRQSKVWITLTAISIALTWGGFRLGDRYGLLIGFFAALGLNALVFFFEDWRVSMNFLGRTLEGRDPWNVLAITKACAKQLALPVPGLTEIENTTPNLLSAGLFASRLKIFISTSLVRRFTPEEIRSLIGRELMGFHLGQTRTTTAAVALADLWLILMGAFDAVFFLRLFFRKRPLKKWQQGPFTLLSFPLVTLFLRLVIRRSSALVCDQKAAEVFGGPAVLAQALTKLDSYSKTLPTDVNLAEAALFLADPLASYSWASWASVQPSIEDRVRNLVGRYPL
jgi:heat shock protein HtpX